MSKVYSRGYLWYVVGLLTIAATLSFIDRQILNVMIGPIKRDLGGLSDTQISLIIGLAFSVVYTLATVPVARLADRSNRRNLIAAGIFTWSMMTALAGTANTFWKLFIARMGVGVGEATLGPATVSLLPDYFEDRHLPLAFGIVGSAPFIGTGLANLFGGPLIDWLELQPNMVLPVFGEMFSWQTVLVIVGLPGILLALLMFTISEPARRGVLAHEPQGFALKEVFEFFKSRRRFLVYLFVAYICLSIQGYAFLTWVVEFFVRTHGWTRTEIGVSYGLIALTVGVAGSVGAGFFAGRLIARGRGDSTMRVALASALLLGPIAVILPLLDNAYLAVVLLIPITFAMGMPPGLASAALQSIAPNQMRGQLIAFYQICVTFISYLFAPLTVGVMNDYVFQREDAINLSLSTLAAVNYTIAATCLLLCLRPFRRALIQLREEWPNAVNV